MVIHLDLTIAHHHHHHCVNFERLHFIPLQTKHLCEKREFGLFSYYFQHAFYFVALSVAQYSNCIVNIVNIEAVLKII